MSFNLLIYTLGGLISAAAPNYKVLQASRFVVGIGLVASSPSGWHCSPRWSPPVTGAASPPR